MVVAAAAPPAPVQVAGAQQAATPAPATPAAPAPSPLSSSLPPLAIEAGAKPIGDTLAFALSAGTGQVQLPQSNVTLSVPDVDLSGPDPQVAQVVELAVDSLPPPPASDFQFGGTSFEMQLVDRQTGEPLHGLNVPLTMSFQIGSVDLQKAGGDASRVTWTFWNDGQWDAIPCSPGASANSLTCTISHLSLFAEVIAPSPGAPLDVEVRGGHFFQQANGFGGAGPMGYSVIDDGDASFWTEFQRLGGVDQLGYPISGRFQYKGFLTQAFQKLVLQWRPESAEAVPLNVLDELSQPGLESWLDSAAAGPTVAVHRR